MALPAHWPCHLQRPKQCLAMARLCPTSTEVGWSHAPSDITGWHQQQDRPSPSCPTGLTRQHHAGPQLWGLLTAPSVLDAATRCRQQSGLPPPPPPHPPEPGVMPHSGNQAGAQAQQGPGAGEPAAGQAGGYGGQDQQTDMYGGRRLFTVPQRGPGSSAGSALWPEEPLQRPPTPTPGYGRTPLAPPWGWTGLVGSGPVLRSSPARLAHCWRVRPGHGLSPPIPLVWDPWGWHVMAKRSVTPSQAALLAQALLQEVPGLLHLPESPRGAAPQSPQPSQGQGERHHGRGRSLTRGSHASCPFPAAFTSPNSSLMVVHRGSLDGEQHAQAHRA